MLFVGINFRDSVSCHDTFSRVEAGIISCPRKAVNDEYSDDIHLPGTQYGFSLPRPGKLPFRKIIHPHPAYDRYPMAGTGASSGCWENQSVLDLWLALYPESRPIDRPGRTPGCTRHGWKPLSRPAYLFFGRGRAPGQPLSKSGRLKGASWAYNEPGSQSGYGVVLYTLALQGKNLSYFGRVIASGSHQTSLQMILRKEVDSSAIDSTVLEMEVANDPAISSQIRIIDAFGPSPIPPWVVSQDTPVAMRQALQELLIKMDTDPGGQAILKRARMARFVPVNDHDYDPIREMARIAFKE